MEGRETRPIIQVLFSFYPLQGHVASDKDGNWRAGAIATLIDNVVSLAIASATGYIKISVAFDISYFSMAKINVRP
ncbi:hypothetical protein MRB53_017511 [Persea americana]|uniref:Uncharacterized protein n=1 Tax=Persea americana TaxID=3435 RepID=A0ACC2M6M4_PERAE|nr:hypothetical protein MRB53_017511 [Persea americana]